MPFVDRYSYPPWLRAAGLAGALALPSPVHAKDAKDAKDAASHSPTIAEVAAGAFTLAEKLPAGEYKATDCTLEVDKQKVVRTTRPQDCAPLWRVEPADKPRDPLTLKNAKGERLELKFDKLATTGEVGATSEAELKALDDGEIYTRAKDGSWSRSTRARIAAGDATFFHYHAGALKKIKPAAAAQAPPARRGAAIGVIDDDDAALAECEAHPLWLESRALCLRVDDNLQIHLVHIPGRYRERIVPPNTAFEIFVVHPSDARLVVKLGGERGLYEPAIRNDYNASGETLADPAAKPTATALVFHEGFSPRKPNSSADLTIEASRGATAEDREKSKQTRTFEFYVEKTYAERFALDST